VHGHELHHGIIQDCAKERAVRGEACGVHKDGVHKDGGHIPNCETSSSVGPSAQGMEGSRRSRENEKVPLRKPKASQSSMHACKKAAKSEIKFSDNRVQAEGRTHLIC
jgi:hypothetical protein